MPLGALLQTLRVLAARLSCPTDDPREKFAREDERRRATESDTVKEECHTSSPEEGKAVPGSFHTQATMHLDQMGLKWAEQLLCPEHSDCTDCLATDDLQQAPQEKTGLPIAPATSCSDESHGRCPCPSMRKTGTCQRATPPCDAGRSEQLVPLGLPRNVGQRPSACCTREERCQTEYEWGTSLVPASTS